MLGDLVYTEMLKQKKTVLPWIAVIGGSLPVITALLSASSENSQVNWEGLAAAGLNWANLLALLLTAVVTGLVFAGEYSGNTVSTLLTYPVPRFGIFAGKFIVVVFLTAALYLTLFITTLLLDFVYIKSLPSMEFWKDFVKLILSITAVNLVLVPVTALVSIVIRGAGTYIAAGMCYIIAGMSFGSANWSIFIPMCVPARLVENYFGSAQLKTADISIMAAVCAVTFLSGFILSAVYYSRSDVYK